MYAAPPLLESEIHAALPEHLYDRGKPSEWMDERRVPRFKGSTT